MAYLRDILPDLKMQLDFSVPAVKNVPEVFLTYNTAPRTGHMPTPAQHIFENSLQTCKVNQQ